VWIGSPRRDLKEFPEEVKDAIGYAVFPAQIERKSSLVKLLRDSAVRESLKVIEDFHRKYRSAIYTQSSSSIRLRLACFPEEIKTRPPTFKTEIDLIKRKLKLAEEHYGQRSHA
jgi:phage-related protein